MKLGLPSPEYRPMAKLSFHKLSVHGVEAKVANVSVVKVIVEG